jgi:hypothetical protein
MPCFVLITDTFGEVATRFSVLGCMGDKGADSDRLKVRLDAV